MASVDSHEQTINRKPRACIPCHSRKVKCDGSHVGFPCSRCQQQRRVSECQLVPIPDRSAARSKRRKRQSTDNTTALGAQQQLPFPAMYTDLDQQRSTASRSSVSQDDRHDTGTAAYNDRVDSTTILSHALAGKEPRRLVKVALREPQGIGNEIKSDSHVQANDYLQNIGAYDIPPHSSCQKLVRLYWDRVFPYVPVLNRISSMEKLSNGSFSKFLLQCIFTSVAPYMSAELLAETGYLGRGQAQRAFFSKAQVLYGLQAEKSQLRLLQGSLMLTSSYFAFDLDKDCRFWLSNAVRLATQIGLHRQHRSDSLNRNTKKLFRRMFWVMYSRDIIVFMGGRSNVRALDERYCDVPDLTEDDWEDESRHELARYEISPISLLEKSYLVHSCRLFHICAQYIETFKRPSVPPTKVVCDEIDNQRACWKASLPPELQFDTQDGWSRENIWILVLRAMAYRLDCFFFRDIRLQFPPDEDNRRRRALQKQRNAMLELDSIIHRIMLHDLVEYCPFAMATCASALVAMHIECALSQSSTDAQRQLNLTGIHNGLAFLRTCLQHWDSVGESLRMFHTVVSTFKLYQGSSAPEGSTLSHNLERAQQAAPNTTVTSNVWSASGNEPQSQYPMLGTKLGDPTQTSPPSNETDFFVDPLFSFDSMGWDTGLGGDLNNESFEECLG